MLVASQRMRLNQKQATSRAKQIDKIELAEIKPSSRQNPFIRFEQDKKLHRLALEVEGLSKGFDKVLFDKLKPNDRSRRARSHNRGERHR